jgi:hypothetical protein
VGIALVDAFKLIEEKMFDHNLDCIKTLKPLLPPIAEAMETLKSAEEEAVSNALAELSELSLSEEEKAEQIPIKEVTTRAAFWTQQVINVPISHGYTGLREHLLPLPNLYLTLFFCIGCLIGTDPATMKDPCGDITWDAIKKVTPPSPLSLLSRFVVSLLCFSVDDSVFSADWCLQLHCH